MPLLSFKTSEKAYLRVTLSTHIKNKQTIVTHKVQ